ncbi:MAG TPA: hypothetical protein VGB84_09520 [Arachidicoccus sp.]
MKYLFLSIILAANITLFSQVKEKALFNKWVKVDITNADGSPLSDDQEIKYSYVSYAFRNPNNVIISTTANNKDCNFHFVLNDSLLSISLPSGYVTNSFKIRDIDSNKLVLVLLGLNSSEQLRYIFYTEQYYQRQMPLKPEDIFAVNNNDTIYNESNKIYATYKNGSYMDNLKTALPNGKMFHQATITLKQIFFLKKTEKLVFR